MSREALKVNRKRRRQRWENGERPQCKRHPERLVKRSFWILTGTRRCASCCLRRSDGSYRPHMYKAAKKYKQSPHGSEQIKWRKRSTYRLHKIQEKRI